jgi:hypothetical protein
MAPQDDMLRMLESTKGQQALQKGLLGVLNSVDGQKALERAARAVLREGFGKLAPGHTEDEFVRPNQQWLFDTVNAIHDDFHAWKEKVRE